MKKHPLLYSPCIVFLMLGSSALAQDVATTMGDASARIIKDPFAMSEPLWPDSSVNTGTVDELAEDIVFNGLQLPNSQLKKMLKKRSTQRQIAFNFSGIPHSPLTISLNDTYHDLKLASELRSTMVKFSETDLRSGFMDEHGAQSIFLDVLLASPEMTHLPLSYFSLTIEHN